MSLFDVIRYPISNPPTEEELRSLPEDLIISFLKKTYWCIPPRSEGKATIEELLTGIMHEYTKGRYSNDIPILRQVIKEYDGSV